MNHVGIDYHKRYSVASAVDEQGKRILEARIDGNTPEGFAEFFAKLGEPSKAVMESCWNWGYLYDLLSKMEGVEELVLADTYKTRLIAEAQIKTDSLDARALANLLRGNFVARVHVPSVPTRQFKNILRQRLFWVRLRTQIRNRIHTLLDRQQNLNLPQVSDIFGVKGMTFLSRLEIAEPDKTLLKQDLAVLQALKEQIREMENSAQAQKEQSPAGALLESIPGVGKILSAVIASEVDTIGRFSSPAKLCAYAGLAPTTHASGGKVYHGRLLPMCNKWLRWAFVEAAWVAVGCSPYFGSLYRHHRGRGKQANTAIIIVARRMCQIVWQILSQGRPYEIRPFQAMTAFPDRSHRMVAA